MRRERQHVTMVTLPYISTRDDGQWSAHLVPVPPSIRTTAEGSGGEWREHIRDGSWTPVNGAVLVDYRGDDVVFTIGRLPYHDWSVPRGQVQRAWTGPAWGTPKRYDSIDWEQPDYGCTSIDSVHPLDYVLMLQRRGVNVTPLHA